MLLDLKEIDRLRKADTVIMTPDNETNLSPPVWKGLLDAAEAWNRWREEHLRRAGIDPTRDDIRWVYERDGRVTWTLWIGEAVTPQAAVLTALGPKGPKP